jgi:hypothetical protein
MRSVTLTLTIDLPDSVPEKNLEQALRLTLNDAFGEFTFLRGPTAKAYVDRRYPNHGCGPYAKEPARAEKILQVFQRVELVEALHRAISTVKVEELITDTHPPPGEPGYTTELVK